MSADTPAMAHRSHTIVLTRTFTGDMVELVTTNGLRGLSIAMRYRGLFESVGANMTPAQARELAADLTARADEIDPPEIELEPWQMVPLPRICDECGEIIEPDDFHASAKTCGSCEHNASRS
jgi:hypothetical protein